MSNLRQSNTACGNESQEMYLATIYKVYKKRGCAYLSAVKDSYGLVRWENTKISRILHNATHKGYQGYLKSRRDNFLDQKIIKNRDEDTYLYVKGNYEPIITEEQWDRCREIREQKKDIALILLKTAKSERKAEYIRARIFGAEN